MNGDGLVEYLGLIEEYAIRVALFITTLWGIYQYLKKILKG